MRPPIRPLLPGTKSLSARLLVLTIAFVMLGEVLIFVPSVAEFRLSYLENKLEAASLALLALEATPDNMVSQELADRLLHHVGAYTAMPVDAGAVTSTKLKGVLALAMPPKVEATLDLRDYSEAMAITDAIKTYWRNQDRVITVIGFSPREQDLAISMTLNEAQLRQAMLAYGANILTVSLIISLLTAGLVYFSLQWLLVRPMRALTAAMILFRADPEDAHRVIRPGRRQDEIGVAERELAQLQDAVRQALHQRSRLAALGIAVSKINHDLKNILATARLVSDGLVAHAAPEVRRAAASVTKAIDRAVTLCGGTLAFTREEDAPLTLTPFPLSALVDEVVAALPTDSHQPITVTNLTASCVVLGDRDQIFRALLNLGRNAVEAGATELCISAESRAESKFWRIDIADNGPGLPPKARDHLFEPFTGSARPGGTGLGLAICREIARAHGGDITLISSTGTGSLFRLTLPGPGGMRLAR